MATIIRATGTATDLTLPKLYRKRLLDAFANIDRAYSFRHIRGAYAGPLVKARRASDSATMDIYPKTDGTLDTAALLAFAGAGDAFMATIYDQGPNAKHLTQATAGAQAKLVAAGALVAANTRPVASFDGVDDAYVGTNPQLYAAGKATVAAVLAAPIPAAARRWWTESVSTDGSGQQYGLQQPDSADNRASSIVWTGVNAAQKGTLVTWDGTLKQISATDTGAAFSHWVNGVADTVAASPYTRAAVAAKDRFTLGGVTRAGTLAGFAMTFAEAIYIKDALATADRQTIEASQKAYFATA
jgi:hypothetical protein